MNVDADLFEFRYPATIGTRSLPAATSKTHDGDIRKQLLRRDQIRVLLVSRN